MAKAYTGKKSGNAKEDPKESEGSKLVQIPTAKNTGNEKSKVVVVKR